MMPVSADSEMVWWGWGAAEQHAPLPDTARALLGQMLRIQGPPTPPGPLPTPAPGRLGPDEISALGAIVGVDQVADDDLARVRHTRGKSTTDLLRIRSGEVADAPDAVVRPGSHEDVLAVLHWCAHRGVAVVPYGGGTSVVGGLAPETSGFAGVVALDLRRMASLVAVDPVSMTATFQPGVRGPQAEVLLAEYGLTLGHFPQSFEYGSLGGFAATRSSGQASAGHGRFDEMVVGLTVATPTGPWKLGRGPATAAGPDLRQLVLGSEGAFGVITELVVAVRDIPAVRSYQGWQVPSFEIGLTILRDLAQHGAAPTVVRLSDEMETATGLANATQIGEQTTTGCYLVLGFEGTATDVAYRQESARPTLLAAGALPLDAEIGAGWLAGRFHGPYLRDALLDIGGLVETVETVTSWSGLRSMYGAVRVAATHTLGAGGWPVLVLCHVSHLYRTGASLYFTIAGAQRGDPIGQWEQAKSAISDAIMAAGGSITHHHAVGTMHLPWLAAEIGDIGVRVLRAIKRELDPTGVLNPGVLVGRPPVPDSQ